MKGKIHKILLNEITHLVVLIIISFMIGVCFVVVYKVDNEQLVELGSLKKYEIGAEGIFIVDQYYLENKALYIEGCFLRLGEDLDYVNSSFVLIDESEICWAINTIPTKRESATEFFNDGYNYDDSGLKGYIPLSKLKRGKYRIGIVTKNKENVSEIKISDKIYERE
ncbi:hypothetical protein EII17_03785 [Clostridiales bacterium COT073_COT-073]|nr:hypothetical protein EII17_03785 [Clostridiales bacterium COT073_COT-073]